MINEPRMPRALHDGYFERWMEPLAGLEDMDPILFEEEHFIACGAPGPDGAGNGDGEATGDGPETGQGFGSAFYFANHTGAGNGNGFAVNDVLDPSNTNPGTFGDGCSRADGFAQTWGWGYGDDATAGIHFDEGL